MAAACAIEGGGVAAQCCARLLGTSAPGPRATGPVLLINHATRSLLCDLFDDPRLLDGLHRIRRRVVAWSRSGDPLELPHSAIAAAEPELLARLRPSPSQPAGSESPEWLIRCSHSHSTALKQIAIGQRPAHVCRVALTGKSGDACCMESVERGWLFLIGLGDGEGSLISVGESAGALLPETRVMKTHVAEIIATLGMFDSHPRMSETLCGPGWLACGSAVMAFDPLCGEGAGNAAREAILACAVVDAAHRGLPIRELLQHYTGRLRSGFLRHLLVCREFYASGFGGPWWDEQVACLDDGIEHLRQIIPKDPPRFRLNGFRLEPITAPAPSPRPPEFPATAAQSKP